MWLLLDPRSARCEGAADPRVSMFCPVQTSNNDACLSIHGAGRWDWEGLLSRHIYTFPVKMRSLMCGGDTEAACLTVFYVSGVCTDYSCVICGNANERGRTYYGHVAGWQPPVAAGWTTTTQVVDQLKRKRVYV